MRNTITRCSAILLLGLSSSGFVQMVTGAFPVPAHAFRDGVRDTLTIPSEYMFINRDQNAIRSAQPHALRYFYRALDSLTNGYNRKVNIVHIGDSHVQADFFSGKIRENFQRNTLFGNGGRGFTFPYSAIRTNNPYNIKVSYTGAWLGCRAVERSRTCDWGLAGMVAETHDPSATFVINPNTSPTFTYPITKVKIFYAINDVYSFGVTLQTTNTVVTGKRVDDRGFVEFTLKSPVDKITVALEKTSSHQTRFTLQGVTMENDLSGVQYHSIGVNGAEVASFLRVPALERQLQVLNPALVIVSLGTNDAYWQTFDEKGFKRNYGSLIQRIQKAVPGASILLTTPGDCYRLRRYANYNMPKAVQQIQDVAEETECATWDFYAVMGGLRSVTKWQAHGLATSDRIHLSKKGYILQGDLLYAALVDDYYAHRWRNSKTASQPPPVGN